MVNIKKRRTNDGYLEEENGWQILTRVEQMVDIKKRRTDGRY